MLATMTAWCIAFAGYLLFAGSASGTELVTSTVLACATSAWMLVIRRCARRRFAFSIAHIGVWLKTLGTAVPASARVWVVFVRTAACGGSPGREVDAAFLRGDGNDPRQGARRATAVLTASLAPDRFVLRAEPHRERVLIHTILPPRAYSPRWLT
ncbi:MAG TPA: hypothetical protein VIM92_06075 [Rhodanobacteraceae bacterium]